LGGAEFMHISLSLKIASLFAISILITGCGSSTAPAPAPAPNLTGAFIDSAVEGISYQTATLSGVTNANGEFQYKDGELVTFSIGDLDLPSARGATTITPLALANTTSLENQTAINIARLLQSLDTDDDTTNGIQIHANAAISASQVDFNTDTTTFENSAAVVNLVANQK